MLVVLAIQPSRYAYTWLANWLATMNAAMFAADPRLPGASDLHLRDSERFLWSWQDASAVAAGSAVSVFTRAALVAGEIRARGETALQKFGYSEVRSRCITPLPVPARVDVLRENGRLRVVVRWQHFGKHERTFAWVRELKSPIRFYFKWDEDRALSLANWLAKWNATLLRMTPTLPHLYDTKVEYARETVETWSDYTSVLAQGWEDCDSLAAAYAGLLLARGWKALRPDDPGYAEARARRLTTIPAEVIFHSYTERNQPGLTHVLVRYRVGSHFYFEDPSARLGMYGGRRMSARETQQKLAAIRRELEAA